MYSPFFFNIESPLPIISYFCYLSNLARFITKCQGHGAIGYTWAPNERPMYNYYRLGSEYNNAWFKDCNLAAVQSTINYFRSPHDA